MRAGQLDRRITIQQFATSPDSFGQPIETWTDVAVVWAQITAESGGESYAAEQRTAKQVVTFTVRYRAGIRPKSHRVVYDGEIYDVENVEEIGRREGLAIKAYAREVQSGP